MSSSTSRSRTVRPSGGWCARERRTQLVDEHRIDHSPARRRPLERPDEVIDVLVQPASLLTWDDVVGRSRTRWRMRGQKSQDMTRLGMVAGSSKQLSDASPTAADRRHRHPMTNQPTSTAEGAALLSQIVAVPAAALMTTPSTRSPAT